MACLEKDWQVVVIHTRSCSAHIGGTVSFETFFLCSTDTPTKFDSHLAREDFHLFDKSYICRQHCPVSGCSTRMRQIPVNALSAT